MVQAPARCSKSERDDDHAGSRGQRAERLGRRAGDRLGQVEAARGPRSGRSTGSGTAPAGRRSAPRVPAASRTPAIAVRRFSSGSVDAPHLHQAESDGFAGRFMGLNDNGLLSASVAMRDPGHAQPWMTGRGDRVAPTGSTIRPPIVKGRRNDEPCWHGSRVSWPCGDALGQSLRASAVPACGGDRDAAPGGDATRSAAHRGFRHAGARAGRQRTRPPRQDRLTPPSGAKQPIRGRPSRPEAGPAARAEAGRAETGTDPAAAGRTRILPRPGHAGRRRAAPRRLPSGAARHRRQAVYDGLEAVQPELRPLSRRRRAGHDHRPPPHRVPEARWSDQYQRALRPDGLRRAPGEGHALLVRARHDRRRSTRSTRT